MAAPSPSHLLPNLFRRTLPPFSPPSATFLLSPLSILQLNPLSHTTTSAFCIRSQPKLCYAYPPPSHLSFDRPRFTSVSLHVPALTLHALPATLSEQNPQISESGAGKGVNDSEGGPEDEGLEVSEEPEGEIEVKVVSLPERSVPNLTVKEKKELASYAHGLGEKLKSQQVGKSGVTENVVMALGETLERNELLKLKIHKSCPGEMEDVVNLLERTTGSAAVSQIGRTVIFYRPSMKKMKVEEKMRQSRRVFMQRRERTSAPAFLGEKLALGRSGRGRREGGPGGSSRANEIS